MADPTLSIVIPTYNRVGVLPRAVDSVLAQTFADFELIVVDDGSTDGTAAWLENVTDSRLRVLPQSNAGVSAARNLGIAHARGQAVTFLDSDDEALPDWLATLSRQFEDPTVGIVSVGARVLDTSEGRGGRSEAWLPRPLGPMFSNQSLRYAPPGTLAVLREILQIAGGYEASIGFAENMELALRLVPACLGQGRRVVAVNEPLVIYHRGPSALRSGPAAFGRIRVGVEFILDKHGDRMRRLAPTGYARHRGVAAVNAARLGDMAGARQHLAAAIRASPTHWQSYARWALTLAPTLARRLWSRHAKRPVDPGAGTASV